MKTHLLLISCAIFLASAKSEAQQTTPTCPPALTESAPPAPPNTHWQSMIYMGKGESRLESVMLFDGHPSELASLMPDQSKDSHAESISTWRIQASDAKRGVWIACTYSNTNAIFTMQLPPRLRQCRMTQRRHMKGAVAEMKSFSCD